jgi:hypothetical protein
MHFILLVFCVIFMDICFLQVIKRVIRKNIAGYYLLTGYNARLAAGYAALVHRFRPTSRTPPVYLSKELYNNSLVLTDFQGFPVSNDVLCAGLSSTRIRVALSPALTLGNYTQFAITDLSGVRFCARHIRMTKWIPFDFKRKAT